MNPMSNRLGIIYGIVPGLLALALSAAAALPAHADWLVTHEGGQVETKGPWQTKGKLVVFTRADDGALASLRASEVDLDASAKLTAAAKVKAEAPPPPAAPPTAASRRARRRPPTPVPSSSATGSGWTSPAATASRSKGWFTTRPAS